MLLELQNNLDKTRVQITINDPNFNRLYLSGTIQLPEGLSDGEYTYFLTDTNNNKILAQGLLQIGDYTQPDKVEYVSSASTNEFIQYQG